MNITLSEAQAAYLEQVRDHLADIPAEERAEVIQDLEAHLAELEDSEVETRLGSAAEFAREFRVSAGFDGVGKTSRWSSWRTSLTPFLAPWRETARRLADVTRWGTVRPVWVWTRGWLLVGAWTILSGGPLRHLLIPTPAGNAVAGLAFVALATAVSVMLDRWSHRRSARYASAGYSAGVVVALVVSTLNPLPDPYVQWEDPFASAEEMIAPGGKMISNIYAFDVEGEPVDVLLYDQDGEPLLIMGEWFYERQSQGEPYLGEGEVRFHRDEQGRIVPNLYPLIRYRYNELGHLEPIPPPTVGFPDVTLPEEESTTDTSPGPIR